MRSVEDLCFSALLRQHPRRNLQTLPGRVNDADRSMAPLGPADDLQGSTLKWVKGVEYLNIRIIGTQGILGVGAAIRTFIVSCPAAACRRTMAGGFARHLISSCQ
jgi:hypothetical protein